MKNNKGFTLMELLVAVFIASMVTIALMTIWKASSMQTSQGQRQAIIRNNLSILMRALHRDITESDLILAPTSGQTGGLLIAARNAHMIKENNKYYVMPPEVPSYSVDPQGVQIESLPVVFGYCLEGTAIRRTEEISIKDRSQSDLELDSLISEVESACPSGKIYMDYVPSSGFEVTTDDNINYTVSIVVHKNFTESETPPIHIELEKIFTKAGGA